MLIFSGARSEDASGSDDEGSLFNDGASVTHIIDQSHASIITINQSQVTSEASSFAPDTDPEAVDESSKVRQLLIGQIRTKLANQRPSF